MSYNHVGIAGNITRDPELRTTQSGWSVLSFTLAVNDRRKNTSTGQWEDHANFIPCVISDDKRAHALAPYLTKGMKVTVGGKLRYSRWEKDGKAHSKIEVVVQEVELPPRSGAVSAPAASGSSAAGCYDTVNVPYYDEDVVF
ncbi:single-stranded DNA-binding protein [uncultured Senegalimassilia sp.]|uniref:single-stranded DNA-binding protein n=1 Tax=uncultured Senegalimassilia sp. TaxID=1714350 RepID=UPI0027DBB909|nr:single-stranded DNA-binding protein [uncultured Senegalimassilia sp.]